MQSSQTGVAAKMAATPAKIGACDQVGDWYKEYMIFALLCLGHAEQFTFCCIPAVCSSIGSGRAFLIPVFRTLSEFSDSAIEGLMRRLILEALGPDFCAALFRNPIRRSSVCIPRGPAAQGTRGMATGRQKVAGLAGRSHEEARKIERLRPIGTGNEFLLLKASELLERAKSSRDNFPRFDRFIAATNAMLESK